MQNNKKAKLIDGNVPKMLFRLSLPMIFGMGAMISFNLIDTYFIGQLGAAELAAISYTFPVVYFITALTLGIGNGAAAVISQAIGRGDRKDVIRLSSDGLMLALIIVAIFLVLGMLTIEPLFRMLGANDETLPFILDYMIIWYPGIIFVVIPMVGNSMIRATGDTRIPALVMIVAVVINVALDPLLIFGIGPFPKLGIKGAAIATVISRFITLLLSLYVLVFRDKMISFKKPKLEEAISSWKKILFIGIPYSASNLIIPVGAAVLLSILSKYGQDAVAAVGVAMRIDSFPMILIMALGSVLGPFIGQNLGAMRFSRISSAVNYSFGFSLAWGMIAAVILITFAEPVARLFNDDKEVIRLLVDYIFYVPMTYGLMYLGQLTIVALNVLNRPMTATAISALRMFGVIVPLALWFSSLWQIHGVFLAIVVANVLIGILAYFVLKAVIRKQKEELELSLNSAS